TQTSPYTVPVGELVTPGVYTVEATNVATNCVTSATITVEDDPQIPQLTTYTITPIDPTNCSPSNGELTISDGDIEINGIGVLVSQLNIVLHTTSDFSDAGIADPDPNDGDGNGRSTFTGLGIGTYYLKVTLLSGAGLPGEGCDSPPIRVDMLDATVDPNISIEFYPNSICGGGQPNGSIFATGIEFDNTVDTYTYAWDYNGTGGLPASVIEDNILSIDNIDTLSSVPDGTYVLTMTNTVTGCTLTQSIDVTLEPGLSTPQVVDLTLIKPTTCDGNGFVTVSGVTIGSEASPFYQYLTDPDDVEGVNDGLDDIAILDSYNYRWFDNATDAANNTNPFQSGVGTRTISGMAAGIYYVRVFVEGATNCTSEAVEFEVPADNVEEPDLYVYQSKKQISCSNTPAGELVATANGENGDFDGDSDGIPDYEFYWYANTLQPVFGVDVPILLNDSISNLSAGDYSVIVRNASTGCISSELYIVPDDFDLFQPKVTTSFTSLTNCNAPNGTVSSIAIENFDNVSVDDLNDYLALYGSFTYSYAWYQGTPVLPDNSLTAISNTQNATGLDEGFYTVMLTDANTGCFTTAEVYVPNEIFSPGLLITLENPLTNCYSENGKPNAQLSAAASITIENSDGSTEVIHVVGGYTFEWFMGQTDTGTPFYVGNRPSQGLEDGFYTVRVTQDNTSCTVVETIEIFDESVTPPVPDIALIANNTSCIMPNNGIVEASVLVDGEPSQIHHLFSWFAGDAASANTNDTLYVGAKMRNLTPGFYSVSVQDFITGCFSPLAEIEVTDALVYPEFVFLTTPSKCDFPTGAAEISMIYHKEDTTDAGVVIDTTLNAVVSKMVWYMTADADGVSPPDEFKYPSISMQPDSIYGSGIYDVIAGTYEVIITTFEGCVSYGEVTIPTEVTGFNLLSDDGDALNSYFHVDCISTFPDNNIKIFNRNGTLVYEADGYDNENVKFTGKGENGLYMLGSQLPNGTYFYVIDKKDGSKLVSGYIELVR
ncbi:MAG: gliding motility-associated C-terminal domain-containing protein, partial [Cyclobacteriaceae bacterium]|nr:gliding motility-associated C-terminal domain-containing protein [Cyclobacteriaceae bacterium]